MAKFRKLTAAGFVEREAIQFNGENCFDCLRFIKTDDVIINNLELHRTDHPIIHTKKGDVTAGLHEWIIKKPDGDYYVCSSKLFNLIYDPVEKSRP